VIGDRLKSRTKVLVLEDQPHIARFIDEITDGFSFIFADLSGVAGILASHPVDIVLVKGAVPNDVISTVTDFGRAGLVPVVMLSDDPDATHFPCLMQPSSGADLLKILRLHIDDGQR